LAGRQVSYVWRAPRKSATQKQITGPKISIESIINRMAAF